jgi:hypothetical protein
MASYAGKGDPSNGTIYISNLPEGTDDIMLAGYFGTIGLLKVWSFARYFFFFVCFFKHLPVLFASFYVEGFHSLILLFTFYSLL